MPILDPAFEKDTLDLIIALLLGGVIGFERDPRRTGIGELAFKDDENRGRGDLEGRRQCARPETAATLWCSAAVGLLAGAGYWRHAILAAALIVGVNLVLRPMVRLINRQPIETADIETSYIVNVTCRGADEAQIRALLVQGVGVSDLHLRELESTDIEGTDRVAVTATLTSEKRREIALEYIVGRLSLEPGVTAARWRTVNTIV